MKFIKAFAEPGSKRGTDTGNLRRRRNETMGDFYRRTGQSAMGATPKTRGNLTTIRPANRGR